MAFYWINDLFWRIIFILQWIICQPNVHRSREAWRSLKFTLANIHLSRSQGDSWTNATWVFWVYFCYLDKYWLKWTCGLLRFPSPLWTVKCVTQQAPPSQSALRTLFLKLALSSLVAREGMAALLTIGHYGHSL